MIDLSTTYLGLKLKNPIIAASSGLTSSVSKVGKLVEAGVGAVVLKSLFEEQLMNRVDHTLTESHNLNFSEANDYVNEYVKQNDINSYLELIRECKLRYDIPIIASINCYSSDGWIELAEQIELAGADALEINLFILDLNKNSEAAEIEDTYFSVLQNVDKAIEIPVSIKLGHQFNNLVSFVNRLRLAGAKGVVLFNRFYEPDIDIDELKLVPGRVFSSPSEMSQTIRWVAIISAKVSDIEIAASTGVHSGNAVIKQLLAGAQAVQICSAIYQQGITVIPQMLQDLSVWMKQHDFKVVDDFRSRLNYTQIADPKEFERSQFMRYFANFE